MLDFSVAFPAEISRLAAWFLLRRENKALAKAWVNFVGATAVISSSFSIASVVRNGVGDLSVTFATATMTDALYAPVISFGYSPGMVGGFQMVPLTKTAALFRFNVYEIPPGALVDVSTIAIAFFGN